MKKKGFTLIELLAVIVILAVIALISIPIILNIIEKSKKSAFQDSVYGIIEAAKLRYAENLLENETEEKTYLIEDGLRELEYNGRAFGKGVLKINKDGKVELAIYNDKWCIRKSLEASKIETTKYEEGKCNIPGVESDPVITLNGESIITLKAGESYEELGAIAKTVDGKNLEYTTVITLNDKVVEMIDINVVGTYKIVYSTSSNGKNTSITRTVMVTDGIGPVITFDPEEVTIKENEVAGYDLYKGVSVIDNVDGTIEVNRETVKTRGELGEVIGSYTITYIATDSNGNVTEKIRTFNIVEGEGPTLNFSNITTGNLWTQKQEITVYASDPSGIKSFSYEVYKDSVSQGVKEVSGKEAIISLNTTGRYTINLKASDLYDNESTLESGIYQIDVTAPILTVKTDENEAFYGSNVASSSFFNEPIYSLSGGNMSCSPENTSGLAIGNHTLTCTVTGGSGKKATATKEIEVKIPINAPNLTNGLIPIKWNGSAWIRADSSNPTGNYQWYDYSKQMWANAASVTSSYRNVSVGTEIPESAINAYFVWIPRYEYEYTSLGTSTAKRIKIKFILPSQTAPSANYKIPSAFSFGGTELSGFWVGKFETTGTTSVPTIKPNLSAIRNQNVYTFFVTAQKFSASGNTYGIATSADSHMMKSSEWGAVAYLSHSLYGKRNYYGGQEQVYVNNNSNFITGCSGGGPSSKASSSCTYAYDVVGGGTGASTTGSIYGVYDMSGGTFEYVMGVYKGSGASSTWGASVADGNVAGFPSVPASKYFDQYTNTNKALACNGSVCYGHALSETNGWYSNSTAFVDADHPWLVRGGYSTNGDSAGLFSTGWHPGQGSNEVGFRVVLQ